MKSIAIIYPFFGFLPPQYNMWRMSALQNQTIDFIFFTDADVEPDINIIVHKMQFCDFRDIVQRAFDFRIVLDRPYKLCEYKQTYGYILHDYIKEYDFWGFGDLDLVFGDIRSFINEQVLEFDFILGWGHFSILRNDMNTNKYFMQHEQGFQNYKEAFATKDITFFDEFGHNGCSDKWRKCRPNKCWLEEPFDNVSKPKQSYHLESLNHPDWKGILFEHVDNKLFAMRFNNGQIERRETLYAHFQHRPFMKDKVKDYSHFIITPSSIVDYPNRNTNLWLRFYCRKRHLTTIFHQWKDRLIWKFNLSNYR